MRSAQKLDSFAWLIEASELYLALAYTVGSQAFISIGEVQASTGDIFSTYVKEVWSGKVWTSSPTRVLREIVESFYECSDPSHPVEMAYEWGGEVCHKILQISNMHRGPLQ